ncbi:MAG: hypothetical protein ABIH82_03090 [Candidatus Woesearchaeota archaeon]
MIQTAEQMRDALFLAPSGSSTSSRELDRRLSLFCRDLSGLLQPGQYADLYRTIESSQVELVGSYMEGREQRHVGVEDGNLYLGAGIIVPYQQVQEIATRNGLRALTERMTFPRIERS